MRIVKIVSILAFALILGACTSKRLYNVKHAPIPSNQSMEQTAAMISKALSYKRWDVVSSEPGKIVAAINVRKHSATIMIKYDDKTYSIERVKSSQLGYNPGRNTIHRNYNRWITLLRDEISYYFANPKAQQLQGH